MYNNPIGVWRIGLIGIAIAMNLPKSLVNLYLNKAKLPLTLQTYTSEKT
jgi:hypothetical protein